MVDEQVKYAISIHVINGRPLSLPACDIFAQIYSFKPEYQGYLLAGENDLCVGLITVPHLYADSLEDWEPQPPANPKGLSSQVMGLLYLLLFNPLNAELNPICYLLALLGAHHFLNVSTIRVKSLTLRLLMPYIYIYGAPILDVSRSHTTTHHSR